MYIFGIDIGGTSIKLGFFDDSGKLIEQWALPTRRDRILEDIAQSVLQYLSLHQIKLEEVLGFGFGIPGIVKQGIALNCVNLSWKNVDLKKEFCKTLGYDAEVYVFNDANIAAYGEASLKERKYNSVVFITLGTGVGGGIVINQDIQEGSFGLGGEIGHIIIDDTYNFECCCGRTGCLETLASATGLVRLAKYFKGKYPTTLSIDDSLTAKDIIDKAREQDMLADKVMEESCKALAKAIANMAVVLNPEAFIIGGGLSNAGDFLLQRIQKEFLKQCIKEAKETKIELAKLRNDAGIYGACQYILKRNMR